MDRKGGGFFVFEGEVLRLFHKKLDDGQTMAGVEVGFWGGRQYLRLADVKQASRLREGAWIRAEAGSRVFGERCYPGPATVTHVDGAKV